MAAIRHFLGLDRVEPPITDESVRRAVEDRVTRQTARVRAVDAHLRRGRQ